MKTKKDFTHILADAMRRERDAAMFYQQIQERVTNPAVREIFASLARDEAGHEQFLMQCQGDPSLFSSIDPHQDYHVATATDLPVLSLDMKPADAIALAMKKEQEAVDLYRFLASRATQGKIKALFDGLATMELSHKNQLESVFTSIGYPEVF